MLPVLLWMHFAVLFFDPRDPEFRGPRNARGRETYVMGRV
jgi:hypothetical protein